MQPNEAVTYKQLGAYLDPAVVERISVEALVFNASTLLKECYPHVQRM